MKGAPGICSRLFVTASLVLVGTVSSRVQGQEAFPPATTTNPVVISFDLRRGQVMVPVRVSGSAPLSFLLDTGYGTTMIGARLAESLKLRKRGQMTIVGIAGEEDANVFEGPKFDFNGTSWTPRRVAAFPSSEEGRRRRRDGILGSGFFRRFVVEIDPQARTLKLHEPANYQYQGSGEILSLTFQGSTPIVEATVDLPDTSTAGAQFEIDTGCTGALCIGRHFVEAHQLASTNAAADGNRFGVGGTTRTRSGHLPQLHLGKLTVKQPSAEFFLDGSPADAPLAGHIGWELLGEYKVVFDYSRKRMILEPKP